MKYNIYNLSTKNKMIIRLWIVMMICQRVQSIFSITSQGFSLTSQQTLIDNVQYELNFTIPTQQIQANSKVKISFSKKFNINSTSLQNCEASTSSSVPTASVTCSVTYNGGAQLYETVFDNVFTSLATYTFLSVKFQISNPYAQVTEQVVVYIANSADTTLGFGSAFIAYTASALQSCSISTGTQITGQNSTHTYKFTPSQRLIQDSSLQVTLPMWQAENNTSNQGADFLSCSGVQNSDTGVLTCSLQSISSDETMTIDGIVTGNKTSPGEIQVQINSMRNPWSVQSFGPAKFDLMVDGDLTQTCSNIYYSVTELNSLNTFRFSVTNLDISGVTSGIRMIYVTNNPFPKPDNRIRISFPDTVDISFSGSVSVYSQTSTEIVLESVSSISVGNFQVTNPPSTKQFTITCTTQVVDSNAGYDIEQSSVSYSCNAGVVSAVSVTPESDFINHQTKYTVTFTIEHELTSGSFIDITFPVDLSIDVSSACSSTSHACVINNENNITVTLGNSVAASSTITVVVDTVMNANEAKQTDTFTIQTFYDDYDGLVDEITSGVTVTMIARELQNTTVTPGSYITYDLTTYRIDVTLNDPIPIGGYIDVVLPSTIAAESPTLDSASFATGTCVLNEVVAGTLRLTNCFAAQLTDLDVFIIFDNIRNPPSLKPTDSFELHTYGPSSSINYISSDLTVTMTTANTIQGVTITPSSTVVHDTTLYTIQIDHTIVHADSDYVQITIPSPMIVPITPNCQSISGGTVACTRLSNSAFRATYTTPADVLSFSINDITNYDIADYDVSYSFSIYDSEGYLMEDYDQYNLTYSEATFASATANNDDNIAVGEVSNVTLTINNGFNIDNSFDEALTSLIVTIPGDFIIGTTCTSTSGACSATNSTSYLVTGVGRSLTNLNVTFKDIQLSYFDPTSQTFKVVYTYNGYNISAQQTGITLSVFCTSPCQRCDTQPDECESCLPHPNTLIYYDPDALACDSQCPDGKYPDDVNQCQNCVSPCSSCLDQQNCTSCVTNTWLYEQDCLSECPDTYYNDDSGVCLECQSPCGLCESLSECSSCVVGFLAGTQCVDAENCPAGTFANTTTFECESCAFPCSQCSQSGTNCTACQNTHLFIAGSNQCVESCPDGMYPKNGLYCFACVSPCDTCTTQSECSSCAVGYLDGTDCVDGDDCPEGTFPDNSTMQCEGCPSECTACDDGSTCTACDTPVYVFYQFQCLASCPPGTYKDSVTCQDCTAPCLTCVTNSTNCLTCESPKLFYNNLCYSVCPVGTYQSGDECLDCLSQCDTCDDGSTCATCSGELYLDNDRCVARCSAGTYAEDGNNTCVDCTSPCSQCEGSSQTCTKCESPLFQYLGACVSSCPDQYFVVDGSCQTCPNCVDCSSATTCAVCNPSLYLYNGVCYSSCPANAPIPDDNTFTCIVCDESCLSCEGSATNCTSCQSGEYLHAGSCVNQCPTGYITDVNSGECRQSEFITNVLYFPFSFSFLFCLMLAIASKCKYSLTETITVLAAFTSICEFGSWILLTYLIGFDYTLDEQIVSICQLIGIAAIASSVFAGITYNITFACRFQADKGWNVWKQYDQSCLRSYRAVAVFSSFSFRFFRLLYSRFFERHFFSAYISNGENFLIATSRLAIISVILNSLPMVGVSCIIIYFKLESDQVFFSSIDTLFLGFFATVFLVVEACKDTDYFEKIKNDLPFMKYRNFDESFAGQSLIARDDYEEESRKAKSEIVDEKEKAELFRKISFVPDLNKFGHLNILEAEDKEDLKSLPEYDKLKNYPQYDPDRKSEGDRVIDDLFFIEDDEERRKREQLQRQRQLEQERRRIEQEERRKKEEQERRKRQLMMEDEEERVNIEFPDLAAIQRVQNKDKKHRRSPLEHLSNCKKANQKVVDEKGLKKLQDISKKNGLDSEFMKQTFGIEKNHNPQLLNKIIDKHNHVKRQSVKQLFDQKNNEKILQQLFNKNSNMDPDKLRQVLNDENSEVLIKNLAGKQEGIMSAQMAKQLFDKNGPYKAQFAKNLLSQDNGMDHEKLKSLLSQNNGKGKQSPLKALKKIGGQNLQNKQMLSNMLGQEASLNPQNFSRVSNDLSLKALKNIFENRSKNSDIITQKILNNKKINLKNLSPILEDEELLEDVAKTLGEGNEQLEENLINLFKNGENIDPVKLKQILNNEVLRQKLLSNPVDPVFLAEITSKQNNTDLNLLTQTIKMMPEQQIQQTFKFDPQKNVDFKNVASIFEKNQKKDPNLISKMLKPDMVKDLYVKGNNETKMLNKLVQKGNQFDPDVIKGVYGKQRNHFFETQTDNLLNIEQEREKGDVYSQKQFSLGFQKNPKSQGNINMSKTAGGMMSFLSPIVPKSNKNKMIKNQSERQNEDIDGTQAWHSEQEDSDDEEIQIIDGIKRRKKNIKLKKLKKPSDLRLREEAIYLQRMEAPHEYAKRKASIRKKKKKEERPQAMDEFNEVFDHDF